MVEIAGTDAELIASLPGGQQVIDWFGFCPNFHDSVLERLEIASGDAVLALRAVRMTDRIDATGHFILDRHAVVTLRLTGVTGLRLAGDAGSIISELIVRRVEADPARDTWTSCAGPMAGDIEVAFDTAVGLFGSLFAKALTLELDPVPAESG
jgi:hypothetical protein